MGGTKAPLLLGWLTPPAASQTTAEPCAQRRRFPEPRVRATDHPLDIRTWAVRDALMANLALAVCPPAPRAACESAQLRHTSP